jgi:hypothetical protein
MRLVAEEEFMVVSTKLRPTRDTDKVPVQQSGEGPKISQHMYVFSVKDARYSK